MAWIKSSSKDDPQHSWQAHYPEGVRWDAPIDFKSVDTLIDRAAAHYGPRPAIDFMGKSYSYDEIQTLVCRATKGLQALGVVKGTRVGLFLPNSPYFLICYYAILKAGGTVVNINPLYAERELEHIISDSETELVITLDLKMLFNKMQDTLDDTALKKLVICRMVDILPFPKNTLFSLFKRGEISDIPADNRHIDFRALVDNDGRHEPVTVDVMEDVAVFQYTGGTTGAPKAAMLTHANVYANTLQATMWMPDCEEGEERMLGVLPFFHAFAMTVVMNFSVFFGAEIIAVPRFELKDVLDLISKKKPTLFPAVPAIYNAINNSPRAAKYDLSSIKFCISGGAPLPQDTKKQFEEKTGCTLVEGYGLSETSPVACCNPLDGRAKTGSIGLPLPQTVIEIRDPEEPDIIKPQGEVGEICVIGPQVMKGYFNKPDATARSLFDGRLHTGDLGYIDEEGFVFIVDRLKDMIITNGYNVYPRNVEEAIYLHPAVEECVVAGLPDKNRGEIVKAWIKFVDGQSLSKEELNDFLEDKISSIEIPRRYEFRDEPLPKTLIGKLSRKDLVEQEQEKKDQEQNKGKAKDA